MKTEGFKENVPRYTQRKRDATITYEAKEFGSLCIWSLTLIYLTISRALLYSTYQKNIFKGSNSQNKWCSQCMWKLLQYVSVWFNLHPKHLHSSCSQYNHILTWEIMINIFSDTSFRFGNLGSHHQTHIKYLCWGSRLVAPPII